MNIKAVTNTLKVKFIRNKFEFEIIYFFYRKTYFFMIINLFNINIYTYYEFSSENKKY